jgi:kynurenine formamidase
MRRAGPRRRLLVVLILALLPAARAGAAKLFTLSLEDVAAGRAEVVDLTHDLEDGIPLFPGGVPFTLDPLTRISDGYYMNAFSTGEHTGTHVDAPAHFGKGLPMVDEIPVRRLISNGILIDARGRAAASPDFVLTLGDLLEWEKANGKIPPSSLILMNTGWHQRWEDPDRYLNRDEAGAMHFPGFAVDALKFLLNDRQANGVGIDTASIDPGAAKTLEAHKTVLTGGRYAVENLDNLDLLPPKGFTVIVGAMKISRGSGAPARVLAIVPR